MTFLEITMETKIIVMQKQQPSARRFDERGHSHKTVKANQDKSLISLHLVHRQNGNNIKPAQQISRTCRFRYYVLILQQCCVGLFLGSGYLIYAEFLTFLKLK